MKYLLAIFKSHESMKAYEQPEVALMANDIDEISSYLDIHNIIGLEEEDYEKMVDPNSTTGGFEWYEITIDKYIVIRRGDFYISQPALKI